MIKQLIPVLFGVSMLFGVNALAAKPASNIDCTQLESAIESTDSFLEGIGVEYGSLGELVAKAILEPETDGTLVFLVNNYYGSSAFTSAKQILSTAGGCGLVPFLIEQINDG
jgi:hypothetical protein